MERGVILRLVYKSVEPLNKEKIEFRSFTGIETFIVQNYKVNFEFLIIQRPSTTDVLKYKGPLRILPHPWTPYCKWHSGPLDSKDEPWNRIYCNIKAKGYCRQHRHSDRYLYDLCLGLKGERALEACKILDKRIKAEYVVYMLDSGATKPKVGTTRAFRIYERISEQDHFVATVLAIYDSLYKARETEMKISSLGFASEHQRRSKAHRLDKPRAVARLSETAEKVSKFIGQEWNGRLFSIAKPKSMPPLVSVESIMGEEVVPIDYWGGLLVMRSSKGIFSVEERPMLHNLSLEIPTEKKDIWYGHFEIK